MAHTHTHGAHAMGMVTDDVDYDHHDNQITREIGCVIKFIEKDFLLDEMS